MTHPENDEHDCEQDARLNTHIGHEARHLVEEMMRACLKDEPELDAVERLVVLTEKSTDFTLSASYGLTCAIVLGNLIAEGRDPNSVNWNEITVASWTNLIEEVRADMLVQSIADQMEQ
jgi:hypothetical protein